MNPVPSLRSDPVLSAGAVKTANAWLAAAASLAVSASAAVAALLALAPRASLDAQSPVRYEISFPNAAHHEAEVTVIWSDLEPGPLEVRMSRTSPGRYALHEFAKNVYAVHAYGADGRELETTRPNPHQWDVRGHGGEVRLTYTLFADRADGTYSGIDRTHAHLNMPATFVWARGHEVRPIEIAFDVPEGSGWRVATQLAPTADPYRFTAPDLAYFLDSPTEVSDFLLREWEVASGADRYTMRLAIHSLDSPEDIDRYVERARKVVGEQIGIFGALPAFDFGTYTFIADYLPWVSGDGMEHRNSTVLASTGSLAGNAAGLLGTLSHELIHAWNVERIRPATLEPFDFEQANMSRELWFAEGFTSYLGPLAIVRAGLTSERDFARSLGDGLSVVLGSPAREFFSPVEMSMQAPFTDRASLADPTNHLNTFISYYTYGAALGLGLDLTLRSRFGLALDDFMQAAWRKFGRTEIPYDVEDLAGLLGEVTGDVRFGRAFFDDHVLGRKPLDYGALLAEAGLLLRRAEPSRVFLGAARLDPSRDGARVIDPTMIGTPLYRAGVDRGDRIVRLGGRAIRSHADLERAVEGRKPGDTMEIVFESRGTSHTTTLTLEEDPTLEVVLFEEAGRAVSDEARAFRDSWLGSRAR